MSESAKTFNQSGYLIIFIALLAIVLIGVFFINPSKSLTTTDDDEYCLIPADKRTRKIDYAGTNYVLIKSAANIFAGEITGEPGRGGNHFQAASPLAEITIDSQDYKVYTAFFDQSVDNVSAINWESLSDINDLLFVEVTEVINNKISGFRYFDIYLKEGASDPEFITGFCSLNLPYKAVSYTSDIDGVTFPPITVDGSKVQKLASAKYQIPNETFYIIAYEPVYILGTYNSLSDVYKAGTLEVKSDANNMVKQYDVYYNEDSVIDTLSLVDQNGSDSVIQYKYVKESLNPPKITSLLRSPIPSPDEQALSFGKKSLQLDSFPVLKIPGWGWWTPECKPAVYLYPEKSQEVSVKVFPKGHLTYTDPLYPPDGWKIMAHPDGRVVSGDQTYPYLYYESKIMDSWISSPTEGFVIAFEDLPKLYSNLLPKLGLSQKETADFKEYWEKALTSAPYYFVGVMDNSAIELIEPLEINPKPDSILRVRLYFQALDESFKVNKPKLSSVPERSGFSVVEWGGMVKNDPDHPFTCSQ